MSRDPVIRLRQPGPGLDSLPEDLHPVIRRILSSRGVSSVEDTDLGLGRMAAPDSLLEIDKAAQLLADAIIQDRRILVVGDFDADGATGTALAVRVLRACGAQQVDFRVPNRFEFGYGLSPGLVNTLEDDPPDLLMTVDSGICCVEGVSRARELGIDVIVTDHHLPGEVVPEANAIVNPNSPGDPFPSKSLAGVGVVFYLLGVLRSVLRERGWFEGRRKEPNLARFLDLVALGTVADVVTLDRNNRVLVRQGIERIRQGVASPGLLALAKLGKRDYRNLVASDLGFIVAPRLNAAGRLEDMSLGIQCLITDDHDEAMRMASELDELNAQRRGMQEQMQVEAMGQLDAIIAELGDELPLGLCLFDPDWHQGIVGLVASRVKEFSHRPVIAFAPEGPGSEKLKGSARSISGLHIRDVLAHVDALHPELIDAFGGHAMAAGLSLSRDRLEEFQNAYLASVTHFLEGRTPKQEIETDGELSSAELNLGFARALRNFGPWGQRFPEPLFEGAFDVVSQRVVGGAHLKLTLRPMDGHDNIDAIAFRTLPEDLPAQDRLRVLYRLDVNHFRGMANPQLVIERIVA